MMRPQRAFIMPRITARDRRNTARRLVSITSSHSSSFMRSARLSRVMPALLTRIAMSPNCFCNSVDRARRSLRRVASRSATLPMPRHLASRLRCAWSPCRSPSRPAAPARAAMAWPMPREAPVTSATFPSACFILACCSAARATARSASVERTAAPARCAWSCRRAPCPARTRRRASRPSRPSSASSRPSARARPPGARARP